MNTELNAYSYSKMGEFNTIFNKNLDPFLPSVIENGGEKYF
jgi:hypothetical protein